MEYIKISTESIGIINRRKGYSYGAQRGYGKVMQFSQLMKLFEDELKYIFWAEKALTKVLPKMINNATSEDLIEQLENHFIETKEQIQRLERVFELIGKRAVATKCEAMSGLIKEAESIMEDCMEGPMCDAGIISAAQKVEHYEIATYSTLRQFAQTLGMDEVESLFATTLEEEHMAVEELSEIACQTFNIEAELRS